MSAVYPTPPTAWSGARPTPPSAGTASSLVLVALILQAIAASILVVGGLFAIALSVPSLGVWTGVAVIGTLAIGVAAFAFLYIAYEYSYVRIQRQQFMEARIPTLVIGIISLFFGVIPGILYLVGYAKISDAVREQQQSLVGPYGLAAPLPAPPTTTCPGCGRASAMPGVAYCPYCGRKL